MLTQICKIAPELAHLSYKLGPVLAFSEEYLCFIVDFVKIELIEYNKKSTNVIRLVGHQNAIKCIKLSRQNSKEKLFCSCSSDSLILWDLKKILKGNELDGRVIGRNCFEYEPTNCSFDPTNETIAVSNAFLINLYDIKTCSQFGQIKLDDCINFFEFSLFNKNLIVISSQTNLLMCHDLSKNETINSIQNISNNSFLNIVSLENEPILLVSSTDGTIHSYKFKNDKFLLLNKINLVQIYVDFLKQNKNDESIEKSSLSVCTGLQVFRINHQVIVSCATSTSIFLIDFYTNNLIYLIDLKNISLSKSNDIIIPQMAEFSLQNSKQINVALLFLFQNEIKVFKCADINQSDILFPKSFVNDSGFGEDCLSVHPKKMLSKDSPLNEGVVNKEVAKPKLVPSMHEYLKTNSITKKNSISAKDKPLTFTSKIKSSGYNATVKREKFTPLINKKSSSMISLESFNIPRQKQSSSGIESRLQQFKFEIPTVLNKKINATDKSSPLTLLRFSDEGNYFAVVSNDNLIQYIPSSDLEKRVQVFTGHSETIRSIDISHDGKLLLSASDDKSTKLWSLKKPTELLIDIKSIKLSDSSNFNIKKPVNAASFFYLDKFILIGTDKNLFLCKYHIDTNKNDLQRYLNNSFVKSVKKFELTFAQSITTISTINSFYSYLVLCGGTDKSIEVFDMNEARSCLTIHDAHSRPFHQLLQNQSEYNMLSYDLFISNAVADGIKLWDLRSAKCVSRLDSHLNRYLPTKITLSPDSFYLCTGSEDRSAMVYDLRMNGIIKKYGVFSDNISCAQFNPKKSQLLCGSQDGKIFNYQIN